MKIIENHRFSMVLSKERLRGDRNESWTARPAKLPAAAGKAMVKPQENRVVGFPHLCWFTIFTLG